MKFDVHSYIGEEIKSDDNTTTEKSIRKSYKNLTLEEAKDKANEIFDSIPENVGGFYLEVHKSYEEQMDAALKSI